MLDPQRTAIFNRMVPRLEAFIRKKYDRLAIHEELSQTMLLAYAEALEKADLSDNYEAYCWRAMMWAGKVYLRLYYTKYEDLVSGADNVRDFSPLDLTSQDDDCNSRLRFTLMVDRIGSVYEALSDTEQSVVSAEFDFDRVSERSASLIGYDKRKRIARKFKEAVKSQLILDS
jgi:hypothetical protein